MICGAPIFYIMDIFKDYVKFPKSEVDNNFDSDFRGLISDVQPERMDGEIKVQRTE